MRRALTVLAVALLLGSTRAMAAPPTYVGAETCKPCHMPEFETWSASAHAAATTTAVAADGFSPACLTCHATNRTESMAGVQCEACHGPGSAYSPIPVMMNAKKAVSLGLLIEDQKLCDGCHDGKEHRTKVLIGKFKHDHREKKAVVDAG
jgi:hypothetical protein